MPRLSVELLAGLSTARRPVEVVERKGIGHPDTICDEVAEAVSRALCAAYLDAAGAVLHHNVDKALLLAGRSTPAFGGGRVDEPMRLILGGRATANWEGGHIEPGALAHEAAERWVRSHLRHVVPGVHLEIEEALRPGSAALRDLFARSGAGANDTSVGVGYAPATETERLVLAADGWLRAPATQRAHPALGDDVKVMAVRRGRELELTVAAAQVDCFVSDARGYARGVAELRAGLEEHLRGELDELDAVRVVLNALDDPSRGIDGLYLTVLGTSAEGADSGEVGRGNRWNGLIPFHRPFTMEATAGKNPARHVGKVYTALAFEVAARIHADVEGVEEVEVFLASRIGAPLGEPWLTSARVRTADGVALSDVEEPVRDRFRAVLAGLPGFLDRLVLGESAREAEPVEGAHLVAALRDPSAYPEPPAEVGFQQTHISWLFFAGERVYKVKQPVALAFLDFSTPALRKHDCEEEVRLNRRLTPWMYLGVAPIRRSGDGHVHVRGEGEVIEHAVEMIRLPEQRMLSARLDRGEVDNLLITELAAHLARFHATARTGPGVDEFGTPDAVDALVRENFTGLEPFVGAPGPEDPAIVSPALFRRLRSRALDFVVENRELLARRVAEGRIRDGHGDLHAGNICLAEQGVAVYDCLEFSERLRCSDVACDLAFLTMDLDLRGYSGFARFLARRYAREAGDSELRSLIGFYSVYRALVRAKVAAIAASQATGGDAREEQRREAMRYAQLAVSYELRPALIVVCGPPAAGKTWLARRVARPFHATLHSADVWRGPRATAPTVAARNPYRSLLDAAVADLEEGRTVVVDAAFATRESRRPFMDAAARLGHPFYVLSVTAEQELVHARLEGRADAEGVAPAPDLAAPRFEPPDEVSVGHVVEVRSEHTAPEDACAALLEHRVTRE